MTPIEILEQLENTAQEKHLFYLNAGRELVQSEGIISKTDLDNYDMAKKNWLIASEAYRSYLTTFGSEKKVS